jgi:hypothetical protein
VRQNISTNSDMFGGAQARAAQNLAGNIQQIGNTVERVVDFVDQEDTRRAREAWSLAQADTEIATEEAKARRGVDAAPKDKPTVSQFYNDKLSEAYGKRTQGLSANARAKFDGMWRPYASVRSSQIQRHQQSEQDNVDVANSEVNIGNAQKDIAADPLSLEAVENAKGRIWAEAVYIGKKRGLSPELVTERYNSEVTKGHLNAISGLLAGDRAGEALDYYSFRKDEIDPRVRPELEAKLAHQNEVTRSQSAADGLWAKHGGDLNAALDEARKSHTGGLEEKVVTQLKVRADEAEHAKKKSEHASYNATLSKVIDAPTAVDALNAAMKYGGEPEMRLRLVNVAMGLQRAERGEGGNPAGMVEVMELVDQGKITDAKSAQAAAGERNLSKTEVGKAVQYAQQKGLAGEVKMTEVTRLAKQWKKNISAEEIGSLAQFVIDDLRKQAPGKPVTEEDLAQRVAGYLWKGETTQRLNPDGSVSKPGFFTPGSGWNETGLQARRSGNIESWIPDVSSDEETDLRVELSDVTGLPPAAFDLDTLRVFKKQKAGLSLGITQQARVPKKVPKAVAAPPDSAPSARERSTAAAAAAILDNSGTN